MAAKGTVRVVVVDENDLVRRGLVAWLEGEPDLEVVGQAHDGVGAHSEVRRAMPDVVLLDVHTSPFADPPPPNHYAGAAYPRDRWIDLFTDRARRVVVLAQEEARLLNHDHTDSEHILLGLIHEEEDVAAKALESLGISLERVRQQVEETIGTGQSPPLGHIPFAPAQEGVRAQSSRGLPARHNYISTEHILLGLIREDEGVGARVLIKPGADLGRVRQQVIRLLSEQQALRFENDWLDYEQLRAGAARVAGRVAGAKRVALWATPQTETCVGLLGILAAGAAAIPLNPKAGESELAHIVSDSAPSLIVAAEGA